MLYKPRFSLKAFLVLGKKILKFFLLYTAIEAILSNGEELFVKMSIPLGQEAPCEIW